MTIVLDNSNQLFGGMHILRHSENPRENNEH